MRQALDYQLIETVRSEHPLIHCITNYVTAADVANIILAAGASPIMSDHPEEVEEVTRLCDALLLNLGTQKETTKEAMVRAGKEAGRLGHPIIFDPVGAGSSRRRTETAVEVLKQLPVTVLRGNASELKVLLRELDSAGAACTIESPDRGAASPSRGVDAAFSDLAALADAASLGPLIDTAVKLAQKTQAVVVMTGPTDIVTDGSQTQLVRNGCPEMSRITGCGCMLDGLIAAFSAACAPSGGHPVTSACVPTTGHPVTSACATTASPLPETSYFQAAVLATAAAGLCGELALARMKATGGGLGSFHMYYLDAVSQLDETIMKEGSRFEIR